MTPVAQLRKSLRPLLQRHPDLAFHRLAIVVLPLQHIWREILIDRTSVRGLRTIVSNVQFLGQPDGGFSLTHAKGIYPPSGGWYLSDVDFSDKLFKQIEPTVLDELRAIRTLDDYVRYSPSGGIPSPVFYRRDLERLSIEIARGNLDSAGVICEALVSGRSRYAGESLAECYAPIVDRLYPLIQARDRASLAEVLRGYEALTVKENGLEHLWEPIPFPLELDAG